MAMKKKSSRKGGTTINFSGVESGGRRCPDGTYQAEIVSAEVEESKAGNPMIVAKWKITEGKFKGVTIFDQISLTPQALWKLKTILEAVGIDPQEDDVAAEEYATELMEKTATIVVVNEKYEGEDRPKVTGYGTAGSDEAEEETEEEEAEEEEPKVRNTKGKKKPADDDEEDEEEESDDDDDAEEDEEDDEEEAPKSKKGGKTSKVKEGSRVKFDDGEGHIVKGTVTSIDKEGATVEDKNGDEYVVDTGDLTLL